MRRATCSLVAVLAVGALIPTGAGAATELGQLQPPDQLVDCDGAINVVQRSTGPGAVYEVPAGGGVLTSWRHGGAPDTSGGRLLVWRPAGGGVNRHMLVARSRFEAFAIGAVSGFATRIPVDGGERLGLRTFGFAGCVSESVHGFGDVAVAEGSDAFDPAPGQTRDLSDVVGMGQRANVAATLEPDADDDSFGDESQDVVPGLRLDQRARAKRSGFPVTIACGPRACDAELGGEAVAKAKRKGGSKKAGAAKKKTRRFALQPTTVSAAAGAETSVNVMLKRAKSSTRKLRRLLKRKSFRKRSKLEISMSATNSLGATGSAEATAKLGR